MSEDLKQSPRDKNGAYKTATPIECKNSEMLPALKALRENILQPLQAIAYEILNLTPGAGPQDCGEAFDEWNYWFDDYPPTTKESSMSEEPTFYYCYKCQSSEAPCKCATARTPEAGKIAKE